MLAWLRGDQGEDDDVDQDLIIPEHPELEDPATPGPTAFAFNAFRNGLFGTPKADEELINHHRERRERSRRELRPRPMRNAMSDDDVFMSSSKRSERGLNYGSDATPSKRNPQSILVTPGNATARKKTVTFGPDQFHEDTFSWETRTGRMRSGLPAAYPGKFPSPYTPKVSTDVAPKRRLRDTSAVQNPIEIWEDKDKPATATKPLKSKVKVEKADDRENQGPVATKVNEVIRSLVDDQIQALRENTTRMNDLIEETDSIQQQQQANDGDITVNLDEPRSQSGVYWKDRYASEVSQAEKKVEYYKARKDTSVEFASRKDEQCSNLATRLKEEMELRRKMQAEIDKWQKLAMESKPEFAAAPPPAQSETYQQKTIERLRRETSEYREIIRQKETEMSDHEYQLDRQRSEIERQARRIKDLEVQVQEKKEAANELSVFNSNNESEIRNLRNELRKAEAAASGKDLLISKFESSQREVERLKQQLALVKEENHRLKTQPKPVTTLSVLDDIPIIRQTKPQPLAEKPDTDVWQSLSQANVPRTKPTRAVAPKITEQSAFPNIQLVDSKPKPTGIFTKQTPLSKSRGRMPTMSEYMNPDFASGESEADDFPSPPRSDWAAQSVRATPKPHVTPAGVRKSYESTPPIMTPAEINQRMEETDMSLPPLSPSIDGELDDHYYKPATAIRPVSRQIRDEFAPTMAAAKPPQPLAYIDTTAKEPESPKRKPPSPIPTMFAFEKTPRKGRKSIDITVDGGRPNNLKMAAEPVVAKVEGVGIGVPGKPTMDVDARRKLAAQKAAEMKAKMKAEAAAKRAEGGGP